MPSLVEIVNILSESAKKIGTIAYICGGTPRDKVMNRLSNVSDLDITTGDKSIQFLAKEASSKFPGAKFNQLDDGHSQLFLEGIKIDFSSNYNLPNLLPILQKSGLKSPTPMQMELYSRDFTCNALLMTLDLKKVLDPIGLGLDDIKKKRLRTCMPAHMTLGYDNKRVVRVLYLAAKLGFSLDVEIVDWVRRHPETLVKPDSGYVTKKLKEAFEYNAEITEKLIGDLGLWPYIPPTGDLIPYVTKNVGRI
jgi:tRNA nucleotidyltransferase/poly(A) polymerase